jgi:hypothetical protein
MDMSVGIPEGAPHTHRVNGTMREPDIEEEAHSMNLFEAHLNVLSSLVLIMIPANEPLEAIQAGNETRADR